MVATAWVGAGDADVAALLVDARKPDSEETTAILEGLAKVKCAEGADPQQDRHRAG